jgi:hypothetical protein
MTRCYNIVIDSLFPYVAGATIASNQYNINWASIMPDKPYKVTMSFSSASSVIVGDIIMGIQANLGGNDVYCNKQSYAGTCNYLGTARCMNIGNQSHYYDCSNVDNSPIYLQQRPNENMITVLLTNGINSTAYATPVPSNYVLILHFEEQ